MEFYNKKRLGDILIDRSLTKNRLATLSAQKQNSLKLGETLIDLDLPQKLKLQYFT